MRYAIIIEKEVGSNNYSAYVPDFPGCIATGDTIDEVKRLMHEGIEFHLEGMRADGEHIPVSITQRWPARRNGLKRASYTGGPVFQRMRVSGI